MHDNPMKDLDKIIVKCVVFEKTNEEIAQMTGYSVEFIRKRIKNIERRYRVKSKIGLVREVLRLGYLKAWDFNVIKSEKQ